MTFYSKTDWKKISGDLKDKWIQSKRKRDKKAFFCNVAMGFDTETSSFKVLEKDEKGNDIVLKRACLYLWVFGICSKLYYGRTYDELYSFLDSLKKALKLSAKRKIVVYVHNLAFDFQFIRTHFHVSDIFAREERKVIYAEIDECIVFKCSYILTNKSLDLLSHETQTKKLVGYVDYDLIRTPVTELTEEDKMYAENDVKILLEYISKQIEKEKCITNIPLTSTGYVRRYYLNKVQNGNFKKYKEKYKPVIELDYKTFKALEKAFAGGYTHANYINVGVIQEKVKSIDFTSSYPFVIVSQKFPVKKFQHIKIQKKSQFEKYVQDRPCVFEIIFEKIEAKTSITTISKSKCSFLKKDDDSGETYEKVSVTDNGRLVYGEYVSLWLTDVDFEIIKKFYNITDYVIKDFYCSEYGYLPKELIECTLKLYQDKTVLKGVEGKEEEYQLLKALLNSMYGMCVTNPLAYDIEYDDIKGWKTLDDISEEEASEKLKKSVNSYSSVLSFAWGVWITAHARKNLLEMVKIIGEDVIYCDTDSIKYKNFERYEKTISDYNAKLFQRAGEVCDFYKLDKKMLSPCDIKGNIHPIGIFTDEGVYDYFKTLGSKRYMSCEKGVISLTVSGVNKKEFYKYLVKLFAGEIVEKEHEIKGYKVNNESEMLKIFNMFEFYFMGEGFDIPADYTGKLTHFYGDIPFSCTVTDYQGHKSLIEEKSYVHLEKQPFQMSTEQDFLDLLYKKASINRYYVNRNEKIKIYKEK